MISRAVLVLLLGCSFMMVSYGMMPGMGMGMGESPKAAAVASDVKYIKCQACEAVVKQATRKVKNMRSALKPGHKLDESDIIEFLETMCDPYKPNGEWLTHYDIVEDGDKLKLVDVGKASKCNTECATLGRACTQLSESMDLSDFSEALFMAKSRSALTQLACYEMTNACTVKAPPVPADRKPGPEHVPMSEEEAQREQMMARMKAAGLGGQMYSRDDIMSQMNDLQEQADAGEFPEVAFKEAGQDEAAAAAGAGAGAADSVVEQVQEVVGQAKEAAAAAVEKAGSFLKGTLGKLSSSFKASDKDGQDL